MLSNIFMTILAFSNFAFADGDFIKHEATLVQLEGQINATEKKIRDAIAEKNKTTVNAHYHELIAEIKVSLKKRKDDIIHHTKEYHHILYEHPEKAAKIKKKYKRFDKNSIKEFEDEINKLLSNVQQNVKKKYNP